MVFTDFKLFNDQEALLDGVDDGLAPVDLLVGVSL